MNENVMSEGNGRINKVEQNDVRMETNLKPRKVNASQIAIFNN